MHTEITPSIIQNIKIKIVKQHPINESDTNLFECRVLDKITYFNDKNMCEYVIGIDNDWEDVPRELWDIYKEGDTLHIYTSKLDILGVVSQVQALGLNIKVTYVRECFLEKVF